MEQIGYTFDTFCKVVLRNAYRNLGRRQKHEISLGYLMTKTLFDPFTTNNYFEQYELTSFVVKG